MHMRPLRSWAVTAVAVGALLTGCSSQSQPAEPAPADGEAAAATGAAAAVQQAAQNTEAEQTARIRLTGTIDSGGQQMTTEGEGVVDFATGDAEINVTANVMGADQSILLRTVDGTVYAQLQMLGDAWIKSPTGLGSVGDTDPSGLLDSFQKAAELDVVGEEDVEGVATTHYSGTVDPLVLLENSGASKEDLANARKALKQVETEAQVDVWVDDADRIVKVDQVLSLKGQSADQTGKQSTSVLFTDFGTDVAIEAPDPADVVDGSQIPGLGQPPAPAQ